MDAVDKYYTKKALKETADYFDITPKEVQKLTSLYSKYLFEHINNLDLSKDLKQQHTRFVIPGVAVVYINKLIRIENDRRCGRLTEEEVAWSKVWFPRTYKHFGYILDKYKAIFKTTDND